MEVIDIAKKIEQYGGRLYLVGGAVRFSSVWYWWKRICNGEKREKSGRRTY